MTFELNCGSCRAKLVVAPNSTSVLCRKCNTINHVPVFQAPQNFPNAPAGGYGLTQQPSFPGFGFAPQQPFNPYFPPNNPNGNTKQFAPQNPQQYAPQYAQQNPQQTKPNPQQFAQQNQQQTKPNPQQYAQQNQQQTKPNPQQYAQQNQQQTKPNPQQYAQQNQQQTKPNPQQYAQQNQQQTKPNPQQFVQQNPQQYAQQNPQQTKPNPQQYAQQNQQQTKPNPNQPITAQRTAHVPTKGASQNNFQSNPLNKIPPFDPVRHNFFIYGKDSGSFVSAKIIKLKERESENFSDSSTQKIGEVVKIGLRYFEEKRMEEAFSVFHSLKLAVPGDLKVGIISGISRTCVFIEPHNDFFELSVELSKALYRVQNYSSENKMAFVNEAFLQPFSQATNFLMSKKYDVPLDWYYSTFMRVFHFARIGFNRVSPECLNSGKNKKLVPTTLQSIFSGIERIQGIPESSIKVNHQEIESYLKFFKRVQESISQ